VSESKQTTDRKTIQSWVEARRGRPSKVKGSKQGGILRIDFGEPEDELEEIDWDEFFEIFEDSKLAFLYQEEAGSGKKSRFNKFISRED
jgi:hypothetical protein